MKSAAMVELGRNRTQHNRYLNCEFVRCVENDNIPEGNSTALADTKYEFIVLNPKRKLSAHGCRNDLMPGALKGIVIREGVLR